MGWWRNANGDALGDGPADVVSDGLMAMVETLGRRLHVGELLAGFGLVLHTKASDLLTAESSIQGPLAAELEIDGMHQREVADTTVAATIRDKLDTMLERVSAEYVRAFDRRPTLGEVLAAMRFVLGDRADTYLEIPEGARVLRVFVVPRA